jgi:16S rRNA (cytidine1402-2'-O)-methyltransferase
VAGTLFLVSTPIGNLDDLSRRAARVLGSVALVAAEDTRRAAKLLNHLGLSTPTTSLHEHNEHRKIADLLGRLRAGDDVAYVTDAGTPLVSDPGADLVRAAREAGLRVEAIPGASAVLAALVASGLAGDEFTFLGFVPAKRWARDDWLRRAAAEPRPVVFFEAPHRLRETLDAAVRFFGNRQVAIARELTKVHEEVVTGRLGDIQARLGPPRGEYTIVVAPDETGTPAGELPPDAALWREFCDLTGAGGLGRREAVSTLARRYGHATREVYTAIERARARP